MMVDKNLATKKPHFPKGSKMSLTINSTEFLSAMKSLKRAKNFFTLLIILGLLIQAAGFIVLYCYGSEINAVKIIHYQHSPQTMVLSDQALHWNNVFIWAFSVSKLLALFGGGMLVMTIMFTSIFALTGGGMGMRYFVSAFLWSLFVMALLSPWQNILRGGLFSGALYSLDELRFWLQKIQPLTSGEEQLGFFQQVRFFAQFLGYPFVSLLVLIMMLLKYAKGYKQLTTSFEREKVVISEPRV